MSGTFVVGIDGTESSRAAVRWALRHAASASAELQLVHVIDDEWATIGARMLEELMKDAARLLEREAEYARSLDASVVVHTHSLRGDVMDELIAASETAAMVIVGTHKTGFISGKVYGSRSLRLAASAHAPVAVIPQGSLREGRGIVAGVDESTAGKLAIQRAAEEAERAGETLTLLRAFTVPERPTASEDLQRELIQHSESRVSEMLSEAAALAHLTAPAVDVRTRSVRRPTAQALVDAAAAATLLVIGDSRRENVDAAMVGSVSHDVLINLTGPTIVVHAGDSE